MSANIKAGIATTLTAFAIASVIFLPVFFPPLGIFMVNASFVGFLSLLAFLIICGIFIIFQDHFS